MSPSDIYVYILRCHSLDGSYIGTSDACFYNPVWVDNQIIKLVWIGQSELVAMPLNAFMGLKFQILTELILKHGYGKG